MLYTQYKDAALKHLNACKTALYGLKFYHGTTPLSQKKREALLHNIFYLSGYTLECVINYALYKRLRWTSQEVHKLINSDYKIVYVKPTSWNQNAGRLEVKSFTDRIRNVTFTPNFWIAQHEFNKNVQLLHILLPNSRVPIVDNSIRIPPNVHRMVFEIQNQKNHWRPELRYETTTPFSQSDIEEFVELTEQVYIKLLTVA
jgi:hypothetical protein